MPFNLREKGLRLKGCPRRNAVGLSGCLARFRPDLGTWLASFSKRPSFRFYEAYQRVEMRRKTTRLEEPMRLR